LSCCRRHRFPIYAKCHSDLVCDAGKAGFYTAELAVCPGLDASLYIDGRIRISGLAQGVEERPGQDSADYLFNTVNSKCLMVGGLLRPSVTSIRIHCNCDAVGGDIVDSHSILQNITGIQRIVVALSTVGDVRRSSECFDMAVKPIGSCSPRRSILSVVL
jgi:hypothetical protein